MGSRINLRLNDDTDKDIIDALSNVKNVTLEVKRLIRLGLTCGRLPANTVQPPTPKLEAKKILRPTVPTNTTKVNISDISKLEANLIANFGFDED